MILNRIKPRGQTDQRRVGFDFELATHGKPRGRIGLEFLGVKAVGNDVHHFGSESEARVLDAGTLGTTDNPRRQPSRQPRARPHGEAGGPFTDTRSMIGVVNAPDDRRA